MALADLHFHSLNSDGKHSVAWLVDRLERARDAGLHFAVLTDHDGIDGFGEFSQAISSWFKPICASEISCTFRLNENDKPRELHLLTYCLNPQDVELIEWLKKFRKAREDRFMTIGEKLIDAGYKIDIEGIRKSHAGVLGRPHIADALIEGGYVKSRQEAFDRFLKDGSKYFVPKWRFDLKEAVELARSKGYLTSIAHPGQYGFDENALRFFKSLGVDAVEVYHPRHSENQQKQYYQIAKSLKMMVTGGSDFHDAEADQVNGLPSLGRRGLPIEHGKEFLERLQ